MADSRARARRAARRSGRHPVRAVSKAVSDLGKERSSGRITLARQRPSVLRDLDNDTPRNMLKKIIQTQPQVSPLAPHVSKREETEEARSELPSKRASNTVEMQLPDLGPEETSIAMFQMTKKRKKFSISEFERAADKRLRQNQAQSMLDSTALAGSLRMSLGSLFPPDTVEKRGLLRKPKNRKAVDIEAFEGGVEQNMLNRKAQDYLVDSQAASGIQTAMLASDAEIVLSNTELFAQPQFDEQSENKPRAPEPQLLDSNTSARRNKTSDAAQLVGPVSSAGMNDEGGTQRYSEDLILDSEHVDVTHLSPKTPANHREDKQDRSQWHNPMDQRSLSEEAVVGTVNRWSSSVPAGSLSKYLGSPVALKSKRSFSVSLREVVSHIIEDLSVSDAEEEVAHAVTEVDQKEIFRKEHRASARYSEYLEKKRTEPAESEISGAQGAGVGPEVTSSEEKGIADDGVERQGSPEAERGGAGAGSLGGRSVALLTAEKSGLKPLMEVVEQADELEDQAIMVELDRPEEELTEDEAEDPESEEDSMKTPTFVHAAASRPLRSTPHSAKLAASKLTTPHPAKPAASSLPQRSPLQPLQAKSVPKSLRASRRKTSEPEIAGSLIKKIFSHYAKMPVTRDAFRIIGKCSERYFKQLSNDLEAYANHARRKTVEMADLEILMRRQGLVTDKMPLHVLIERYLPLEYRKLLIPVAVSGNKVIPCK